VPKKLSSVIYEIDCDNPSKIANFDAGKLVTEIGDDLKKYCGRPVQGLVVKTSEASKIVAAAIKDLGAKKLVHAIVRAGISGDDLVFQVTDKSSSKYEKVTVLHAGYKQRRDEIKDQKGRVVNFDPKDATTKDATEKIEKALDTKAKKGTNQPYGKITGSGPLVIVAHGSVEKPVSGATVYGKNFAKKSATELVKILTENSDEDKRLSLEYSGTIYLDGCYTATPNEMGTYVGDVWKLLKGKGYSKLKVKGNIGAAGTTAKGSELVTTPEAEEAKEKLIAKFERTVGHKLEVFDAEVEKLKKALATAEAKLKKLTDARAKIWVATFKATNDKDGFIAAPLVKQIDKEIVSTLQPAIKKLKPEISSLEEAGKKLLIDIKKIPGYEVEDFVGQYGLEIYR
jgi:hypothetical protein